MITKPKQHGGKRPGSGRKKGSGNGRKVKTVCICLSAETLAAIDRMRGKTNRSKFFRLHFAELKSE